MKKIGIIGLRMMERLPLAPSHRTGDLDLAVLIEVGS